MDYISSYKIDVKKIADYLKSFKAVSETIYNWKCPTNEDALYLLNNKFIDNRTYEQLIKCESNFDRNVILKLSLSNLLRENPESVHSAGYWLVTVWGGIRTIRKDGFEIKVKSFLDLLDKGENVGFENIASLSKVSSFWNPSDYIIYDSRVAYALNWIMLKTNASECFFPIPEGRNTKMMAFSVEGLIRLKYKQKYMISDPIQIDKHFISNRDKSLYIPEREAYQVLCQVIKGVNQELWHDVHNKIGYPFYTEMILFAIADREILVDILHSCSLNISE